MCGNCGRPSKVYLWSKVFIGTIVLSHSAYLGCYFDQESPRKLGGERKDFPDSLTPQVCMNFCRDQGYPYAGLQFRSQCFCGDQRPTDSDKKPDSECNLKCSGNDLRNCGGDWRNSVYESGFTDALITDSRYMYMGCFIDQEVRELGGYFHDFGNDNSPEVCVDLCKTKGFAYAGLQYRTQCFCGDQDPMPAKRVDQVECRTKCPGDKRFNCGGNWRNIVYKTTNPGARSLYLGCYADQKPRNLRGDFKDFANTLTPQECMDYCKNKGYPFAGLQFSSQCFCGDEKPNVLDKRPEADCNKKCSRDQSQICGGDWRNSVYLSGFTGALIFDSRYKYIGCYADQETRELSGYSQDLGGNNSPERCITLCKVKSYTYAGLQYRTQCFCGNEEPKPEKQVDQQECKTKCPGDKRFNCGGDWRNNVYKTEQSAETNPNYLGCYFDDHPARRLSGEFKDFGKSFIPQMCIDFCKEKGYPFAGLQYSVQCFCGDIRPSTVDLRPETDCDSKCSGDETQICGGGWRNSVYKTGFTEALITDRKYEYVGCFVDQEPRALSGYSTDLGDSSSPEKCISVCKVKGYVYAGLQYRTQCYCGDEQPLPAKQVDQQDCKYKCPGDKRFNCGGDWRNNVYKTGNLDPSVSDNRYQYLGCYKDQDRPRELRGPSEDFGNENSPEKCVNSCKDKCYVYAGLQYTTQCFCGDQDPKPGKRADPKECKFKCPADYKFNCGGDWRNSVYKTGHPGSSVSLAGYEYMGCYRDQVEPRLLSGEMFDYPETLTPSLCVGVCQKKGYVYAGLQYSSQCFCGDNEVLDSYKTNEEECHMKCSGDCTTICGGVWRLTVYRTGNKAPSIAKLADNEYVGCYRDQADPRLLQGHMQDFPETLTPQLCIALCKRKGYVYAGLQVSVQCFCGDAELPASNKVSDSDCSAKCSGDRSVFCGGSWRNTVYKTGNSGSSIANIGYLYMGCYIDISYPRKLSGFVADYPETLTPQHCVTVCKQKGFQFAGLQGGSQCFCGNEFPADNDKKPDSECNSKCSGDLIAICGGVWRNTIYSTANSVDNNIENVCITSVTRVNGKAACQNEVVFEDDFNSLSSGKWSHIIQIPNDPDYQFVIYKSDPANAYTQDGKLVIKPTLLPDTEVLNGDLHLKNCTGNPGKNECGYKARSFLILPPVQSAHLTTSNSFSFQYGKVEISAKLPAGDWLVPEIWLEPKNNVYGPSYASGRIRIAMSRGNSDLKLDGKDIGSKQLESGVLMGVGDNIRGRTVKREISDGWHKKYHNYSVTWTPENILFMIDGQQSDSLIPNDGETLSDIVGFTLDVKPLWSSASKIAPFDNDFYISLGVSVGGIRNFPDDIINNGKPKPWRNLELKGMLNFWRDKDSWQQTWHDDTALLKIDYIKVTAL